jgi:hypothetical protein
VFQGWLHEILSPQQIDSFYRDKKLDSASELLITTFWSIQMPAGITSSEAALMRWKTNVAQQLRRHGYRQPITSSAC